LQSFKPQENELKKLLILMLIASAPANAQVNKWADIGCGMVVEAKEGVYTAHIGNADGVKTFSCEVWFWPIKNPVGLLKCDNGEHNSLEMLENNRINFGGAELHEFSAKNPAICD
jgi:hypothetical protein